MTTTASSVLTDLDERAPTSFYWSLTLLATVGGFLFGYDTSNIGSALNFLPYALSGFALGYLVAGASVGAAVGALFAGPVTDLLGRKSLMVIDAGIYAFGALLSSLSWNVYVLLIARTLIGLAVGADSAVATAYIAEYAPRERRGALSFLQQWMITIGIQVAYVVALVILRVAPRSAGSVDWRLMFGLCALPALFAVVLRARMPESPRWLLRHGRYGDVSKALGKLGIQSTEQQIRDAGEQLVELDRRPASVWTGCWCVSPGCQ